MKIFLTLLILITIFFTYTTFSYQSTIIDLYKRQNKLLLELADKEKIWCDGLNNVNKVCETTLLDIMERLGLDNQAYPLINTVMWRKSMHDYPIKKARKKLGAPETANGKDLSSVSIGGGDIK